MVSGCIKDIDRDTDGRIDRYELVNYTINLTGKVQDLEKKNQSGIKLIKNYRRGLLSSVGIVVLLCASLFAVSIAVAELTKDTAVSSKGVMTAKGTEIPVETGVHNTIFHLGQPVGEDKLGDVIAPQDTKKFGCITPAEAQELKEKALVVPATLETEEGSLHTLQIHDWEQEGDTIKITDPSGVHYEIKPEPSCSSQIKRGRRLQVQTDGLMLTAPHHQERYSTNTIDGSDGADIIYGADGRVNDIINGLGGDDKLFGGDGGDYIRGGDGADIIYPGSGYNYIRGGNDYNDDTVVYPGLKSQYSFYHLKKGWNHITLIKNDARGRVDALRGVEIVEFSDQRCVIDTNACMYDSTWAEYGTSFEACPTDILNPSSKMERAPYYDDINGEMCYDESPEDIPNCFVCQPKETKIVYPLAKDRYELMHLLRTDTYQSYDYDQRNPTYYTMIWQLDGRGLMTIIDALEGVDTIEFADYLCSINKQVCEHELGTLPTDYLSQAACNEEVPWSRFEGANSNCYADGLLPAGFNEAGCFACQAKAD